MQTNIGETIIKCSNCNYDLSKCEWNIKLLLI